MTPRKSGFSCAQAAPVAPLAGHARGGLSEAAKEQWTYLEFLDQILRREVDAKQGKRIRMGLQIAHFPCVRTIEGFELLISTLGGRAVDPEVVHGKFHRAW